MNDLFFAIQQELGSKILPNYELERKGDIKFSYADISKAKQILNYNVVTSFENGIKDTVSWYVEQFK